MIDVERAIKWVTLFNAVLWTVLVSLWVISTIKSVKPAQFMGLDLFPVPPAGIEDIARSIVGMLYTVFKWVIVAVTVLLGIESALGLARDVLGLVGISVPRASLNTLIKNLIQLLLIKAIVDSVLNYFKYVPPGMLVDIESTFLNSWLGWLTVKVSCLIIVYLIVKYLHVRIEVEIG
jgi:uncharacterized membrane protein